MLVFHWRALVPEDLSFYSIIHHLWVPFKDFCTLFPV